MPARRRECQGAGRDAAGRRPRHRLRRHRHASDAGRSAAEEGDRRAAEKALDRAGITCNKNGIPFDPEKPAITSGIRLGSPAGTTRGFGAAEFREIGELIAEVLDGVAKNGEDGDPAVEASVRAKSVGACASVSRSTHRRKRQHAMRCPFCGHDDTQVKDCRPTDDNSAIRRRRHCPDAARASPPSSACSCAS